MSEHSAENAMGEVWDRLPGLMYERSRLHSAGIDPTAVLLPARLNVPYDGDHATDFEGSCMGLPIVWSERERWGLIVTPPAPKTRVIPPAECPHGCVYYAPRNKCPKCRVIPPGMATKQRPPDTIETGILDEQIALDE